MFSHNRNPPPPKIILSSNPLQIPSPSGEGSSYSSAAGGKSIGPELPDSEMWQDDFSSWGKWMKEYINEYTVTMDIKLLEDPPRDGISLFQTALIHAKDNKRSGKTTLSRSDGECIINQAGGVGQLGTFGDVTKAKVETGVWKRVVVAVKCVDSTEKDKKGELRTWVGTEAGVVLKEDTITANERFAIDPDSFFLFSSAQATMMPGTIAIRTIRIEKTFATDMYVMESRARDKVRITLKKNSQIFASGNRQHVFSHF